jgi:hypothetical protein
MILWSVGNRRFSEVQRRGHIKDDPTVMTNKRGLLPMRPAAEIHAPRSSLSIHGRMEMVGWMDGALLRLEKLSREWNLWMRSRTSTGRNRVKAKIVNMGNAPRKEFPDLSYIVRSEMSLAG